MKTVIAAALGECVHVAGVLNFLKLAEMAGYRTLFLGPAVTPQALIEAAVAEKAALVGVSYRLTPETGERLLADFAESASELHQNGVKFVFGGTPPVAARAQALGFFEQVFDGNQPAEEVLAYLKGDLAESAASRTYPQTTLERIAWKAPLPILRHHFGLPTMQATLEGITKIAEERVIDVISLGVDQDAQENFYHPERQDARRKGAGGVPVRSPEDYRALHQAAQCGNHPLMRTYSGTDDFIQLAEMVRETIHNAWCAIPLFWFNQMDGRGPVALEESIVAHQKVMAWYGERGVPVELNEAHHWGMRDAHDVIFVVASYLSALNAKQYGVRDFILPMMFNSPPGTSPAMDLAKMLAVIEIVDSLQDAHFHIWRQTRTGLLSYPLEVNAARAHLAATIQLQMTLKPHILHIVGHTEADHAATAEDVIDAAKMARWVIESALQGQPNWAGDAAIQARKASLLAEAQITLQAIQSLQKAGTGDPLCDADALGRAVRCGILDAPHLRNNPFGRGKVQTAIVDGACLAVDASGKPITEQVRLQPILAEVGKTASL